MKRQVKLKIKNSVNNGIIGSLVSMEAISADICLLAQNHQLVGPDLNAVIGQQ